MHTREKKSTLAGSEESTTHRILEAAGIVFAERGYDKATIRQICERADANVAAVNYHYRDKQNLYFAVLEYTLQEADRGFNELIAGEGLSPEERLRGIVRLWFDRELGSDRLVWFEKIMAREFLEPTGVIQRLVEKYFQPRLDAIQEITRSLLGPQADEVTSRNCAISIIGQCNFIFHLCLSSKLPRNVSPLCARDMADHIVEFSLQAISGIRKSLKQPK